MSPVDAIIIGSGPNGLVAANVLVDEGWEVLVLEAQPRVGGAVASDESVRAGWVHDTFSSFYPLAAVSPTIRRFDLESVGLRWSHAPAVAASPWGAEEWAVVHRSRDDTAAGFDAQCRGDGDAWLRLCRQWDLIGDDLVHGLLGPFPPIRTGAHLLRQLVRAGFAETTRQLLLPAGRLADEWFRGEGPKVVLAAHAAHADIPLDAPGSGLMGLLLVMVGQQSGFPVPRGGAGELAKALETRLVAKGGGVRTQSKVDRVLVANGRATGVRLASGEIVEATRAVLADVSAPALYGSLLAAADVPSKIARAMTRFEWDPGTVKVDWALSEPIPWDPAPVVAAGTVHLADSIDELARAAVQLTVGRPADRGLVIVGQMATADPTRAPAGCESVWAYTHVPHRSPINPEDIAASVEDRIVERAPHFRDVVLDRRVLGPDDLESLDENLVGGALNGGTAALHQQLMWRPVPGRGRAETPVKGLYLASASAHPGGGVHGACGANAARAAIAHHRLRPHSWSRSASTTRRST